MAVLFLPRDAKYGCCDEHKGQALADTTLVRAARMSDGAASLYSANWIMAAQGRAWDVLSTIHTAHLDPLAPLPAEKLFRFLIQTARMQSQYERAQALERLLHAETDGKAD